MDPNIDLAKVLKNHKQWLNREGGTRADLSNKNLRGAKMRGVNLAEANLAGADLSGADLSGASLIDATLGYITLCGATIDGVTLSANAIGGPGHILCALTQAEWEQIEADRSAAPKGTS